MDNAQLWHLAYALAGPSLLGRTTEELLGELPLPIRRAVLRVVQDIDDGAVDVKYKHSGEEEARTYYEWLDTWKYLNEALPNIFRKVSPKEIFTYTSVDAYFEQHMLNPPIDDSFDEHYAERLFISSAFVPVFGLNGLSYLQPQVSFRDSAGKSRRIDFVIQGRQTYALEVEGFTYHNKSDRARFQDEAQRNRGLAASGYHYIPFTYHDIKSGSAVAELRDIASSDPILNQLATIADAGREPNRVTYVHLRRLLWLMPPLYQKQQELVLALIREATNQAKTHLIIVDQEPQTPALALAIFDIVALVERVAALYNLPITLPRIEVIVVNPADRDSIENVLRYHHHNVYDCPGTSVRVQYASNMPPVTDYIVHNGTITSSHRQGSSSVEAFIAPLAEERRTTSIEECRPQSPSVDILNYFARRYFKVASLKPQQATLIHRALDEQSCLGLLPTS